MGDCSPSKMIIFDGLYSFISIGLTLLSLAANSYILREDKERFHFGKDVIEPLVITFKSSAIITMCLFAISTSVIDLFRGGRDVAIGHSVIYGLVTTVLCGFIYIIIRNNHGNSELLKAETAEWLMDMILSVAVFSGFIIAFLLNQTTFSFLSLYIDPVMVMLASLYFLKIPSRMLMRNARELLWMAPYTHIQNHIEKVVQRVKDKHNIDEEFTRVTKVGKTNPFY
ncbi:putative Co/Zn/Cd cation transporter (cation efflux family) [Geomicrobium halophilum]|uniref:Putative Co/Zn/Cd cation transporter (Cation efflux family) n=1 Tax=Geomicrobium halophilum TaxID=549000 RepID=A0A841PKA1_9BACL|nr:cation transporter [Geomicrobium halophilum]MBB6449159.1 putative Co/Zn/Cd cation transporter (cation efflux family) [Geomicrobium halophilum]